MSFSPKTSAEAPPQEPFLGSNAAKARERKLARKRWQRRRRLGEKVRVQAARHPARWKMHRSRTADGSATLEVEMPAAPALAACEYGRSSHILTLWFWLVAPLRHKVALYNSRLLEMPIPKYSYQSPVTEAVSGL
jgi:hypothetical protein